MSKRQELSDQIQANINQIHELKKANIELYKSLELCVKFLEEAFINCKPLTNITELGESTLLEIMYKSQETLKKATS